MNIDVLQGPLSDFYTRRPVVATTLFALVWLLLGGFLWWLLIYYPAVKAAPFRVRFHTALRFGYPGPLIYVYDSKFGKRIAPVGYAVVLEIINNRPTIAKVHDYLLDIDVNNDWRPLPNLQALNPRDFYWVVNSDLRSCGRLDFTETGFDFQARRTNLQPGESIKGWMFFEWPPELRGTDPTPIRNFRIRIENAHGELQTETINTDRPQDPGSSALGGGSWRVLPREQNADLSGVPILPFVDLLRGFKDGTTK